MPQKTIGRSLEEAVQIRLLKEKYTPGKCKNNVQYNDPNPTDETPTSELSNFEKQWQDGLRDFNNKIDEKIRLNKLL
jgi:hypothetical protein